MGIYYFRECSFLIVCFIAVALLVGIWIFFPQTSGSRTRLGVIVFAFLFLDMYFYNNVNKYIELEVKDARCTLVQ